MKIKIILFITTTLLFCFFSCNKSLEKQGDELVSKIEIYKEVNGKLPRKLEDLGIKESLEGPLFYVRCDSVNYMVYYGTTLGESMYYYSDTRKWDYRLRGMGKNK